MHEKQVHGVLAAVAFAPVMGMPFNRHWIVHIERAGVRPADGAAFIGGLLSYVRRCASRAKVTFAAVWIREGGRGKGAHVHILLHVGDGLSLKGVTRKAVRAAGGTYRRGVSRVVVIGGRLSAAWAAPEHYAANFQTLLAYVLKGCPKDVAQMLELPRWGEGGHVIGKRAGWTQNIGAAARERWAASFRTP